MWYAGFAGNLIALWTIIEMGLVKGDHYANRFGPPAIEIGEEGFEANLVDRARTLNLNIPVE